ncbi:MAG: zinc-dependent metalloprotease [Fidelibacterota bacterium]
MKSIITTRLFFIVLAMGLPPMIVLAQHEAQDEEQESDSADDTTEVVTIEGKTEACRKYEGLFTIYQDTTNGKAYMTLQYDQLGKEFIYFTHTVEGVIDAGHVRGGYEGSRVVTVERYFNRVEIVSQNTGYYFDPNNPLSRAAEANISPSILASQEIVVDDTITMELLIEVDDVFLTEALHQVKPTPNPNAKPGSRFSLGNLNKEKTKYVGIRNYPLNTDVVVEYVYDNPAPVNEGGGGITDARSVRIRIQHSFIEMPENNYKPRRDDPRVGYFLTEVTDMTSPSNTPYRDLIHRWHLEKKNPEAEISEPKEPITFWIENTTPLEFRGAVQEGVLRWNEAFEKAGFRDAIQVKVQPDNAEWDAGDVRYNVIRWTSSPDPVFGGLGPSFVNPRTGQILGADIMLEWIYFTWRVKYQKLYDASSAEIFLNPKTCSYGDFLHQENLFGLTALQNLDNAVEAQGKLVEEALISLVLHEVGHTLGLAHNFQSSQLHSLETIHDRSITEKTGVISSIMDYDPVNLNPDREKQGQYYSTKPGPYDLWAIEYGYSPALEDPEAEDARLREILSRSTEPALRFGNDADDMRSPGKGIDPRIMVGDLTNDAIGYSEERMGLIIELLDDLREKYGQQGSSYHAFRDAFNILVREYRNAAKIVSRYIGGVYIDRSFVGQQGADIPLKPVSYSEQKRALAVLRDRVFAPDVFSVPDGVYDHLKVQRRGWEHWNSTEDPKLHEQVLTIHKVALDHLLHPTVLTRINDTELYGNGYSITECVGDLTDAIFAADARGNVNSFRRNLQVEYVTRLITIIDDESGSSYDYLTKATAYKNLLVIRKIAARKSGDTATTAHREYLAYLIDDALKKG